MIAVPVSFHPAARWRVLAGPGVELTPDEDKFLLRVGAAYEFELNEHWSLSPELVVDFIEGGSRTVVGGLAVGYGF